MNLNSVLVVTGLLSYLFYLLSNVIGIAQITYLFVSICVYSYLLFKKKTVLFFDGALVFLAVIFILYACFRWVIAGADYLDIKAMTFGTTGGMLYGLLMGTLFVCLVNSACEIRAYKLGGWVLSVYFLLIINLIVMVAIALNVSSYVRNDILLIEESRGDYQRSGNYLAMYVISVFYIVNSMRRNRHGLLVDFLMLTVAFLVVYVCQILGSNAGAAVGLLIITLVIAFIPLMSRLGEKLMRHSGSRINLIFTPFLPLVTITGVACLLFFLFFGEFLVDEVLGYDSAKLRMFAYGGGISETFSSRFELLSSNLSLHFNYAPFWGEPFVDRITTGEGTYIHSLIAIWTHLGFVGGWIFLLLFLQASKSALILKRIRQSSILHGDHVASILYLNLFLFLGIIFLAMATAFFTWLPLWFVIGMVAIKPFFLKAKRYAK